MYSPKHFSETDSDEIFGFIEANSFGQLISKVEGELFASHLPFELSEDRTQVVCHLARQNPQHLELEGQEVLVTLQGPHGYISPSWYAAPGVPTWNYQAVHIRGTCKVFNDIERLQASVEGLAGHYESAFEQSWQPEYEVVKLKGIVGVEITITDLQCKYKLSQNRSAADRAGVIRQLRDLGSVDLAAAMERLDK